ncbi:endonuclease [Mycolicibacter sp. MYC123]|uniref:Endonuclease n=2 Tax=Mycolicibacter TaxID=1073531 RepID=A0ABU5YND8_9MYCO|nr:MULTISPECIES: endonuclease [unclassified Mycolicibacter]MEB3050213.1 endonuclease [Mycolicibacter sp. MYC123]MEB3063748.1 endonuclease [Mycolicibacter sp. MYC101]MEB3069410.1 endonuclease [Mycolicibacter sp. MYC017]
MHNHKDLVRRLLRRAGSTYAQEAGIRLRNQPMPLFQLLVLCLLAGQPTDAAVAARAARELFRSGLRTPHKILAADRSAVLRALTRAQYRRYDESSATALVEIAATVQEDYRGDLRLLAERSGRDTRSATALLKGFSGIGDAGAEIFLREVQDVWPWARSTFDDRALEAARDLGLPGDATELGALSLGRNAELAAALVRYSADADVRARLAD